MKIQDEILNAFNLNGELKPLKGGQNTSVRVNDAVLKPVGDNVQVNEWLLGILNEIDPYKYRLAKPVISNDGTFIYNGWCCTRFEPGEHRDGDIKNKLEVSRLFHHDLADIDITNIPIGDDPWSVSQGIVWQKENLPQNISKTAYKILEELISKATLKGNYKVQVIHADLSGNILFDKVLDPLIIDFSPTIAPVEYAEAILVCDCIAWQGSPITDLGLLGNSEYIIEMILRAVIFRLSVAAIFAGDNQDKFIEEYQNFKSILDYIDCKLSCILDCNKNR
jgi:hypothetical protein